jgi:septum formation protein
MTRIVLASNSLQRALLLQQLGLSFEIDLPPSEIERNLSGCFVGLTTTSDERIIGPIPVVTKIVEKNAFLKANAVSESLDSGLIISGDTIIITQEGEILGKPQVPEIALEMLKKLVGTWHQVVSAVAVIKKTHESTEKMIGHVISRVKFWQVPDEALVRYIDTGEPLDKAGAYAIQGLGSFLVARVNGSYSGVVGLPLELLIKFLEAFDIRIWQQWRKIPKTENS